MKMRERFEEDGYVVIRQFLSPEEVHRLREAMDDFMATTLPDVPPEHVFFEDLADRSTLKQIQHLDRYGAYFKSLFERKSVVGLAESLLGGPVIATNMQWFNKPPVIGKETPPHQDGYYFMLEPNEALTMWLAIDQVNEENGCVRYIPASHKEGMRSHAQTGVLGFSQGIADYNADDLKREVPMIVEPGDLIVHHSLTIHRANGNGSKRTRKGLGFIFYSAAAKEDQARQEAYQERLREELRRSKQI